MLDTLEKLSLLPGVSGDEEAVRSYILDRVSPVAQSCRVDPCGNVLVFKRGKQRSKCKVLLSAHMDEVGLIITGVREDGLLTFDTVGGILTPVLLGRTVLCGKGRVPGVIGLEPLHLISSEKAGSCPDADSLCIDIGAEDKEQALLYVTPGERCVFDTAFERLGEHKIKGKALDDRAGCAVLLDIFASELEYDTYFAFTTMEEVGARGAACAAFTVEPDVAIVVEATTAADIPAVPPEGRVCELGKGAVVSFMDRSTVYDGSMYRLAMKTADKWGIAAQPKQAVAGGNDAGSIHRSRGGVHTVAVSLPCRYLHSPASVIDERDLVSVRDLVQELAAVIPAGEDTSDDKIS